MRSPKISIIIPVYNTDKYLRKCLDSVVAQSMDDIEIICVNDGSTDNSLSILEEYAKNNKNIKIISQDNRGLIGARITGYKAARGKFIGWVDADDFIEKKMFETLYKKATEYKADIAYCNYNFFPSATIKKEKWFKQYKGETSWKFIMNNTLEWNKIVKKELLDSLNITELFKKMGEGCYGIVMIKAKGIVSVDECLYNYRVGHSSLSSNYKNLEWYKTVVEKATNTVTYLKQNSYEEKWIEYYQYRYLYYNLVLATMAARNRNKKVYQEAKKVLRSNDIFGKKYREYFVYQLTIFKRLFFKYFICLNYRIACITTRILIR